MEKKNQKDKATQNLEKEVTNLVTVYMDDESIHIKDNVLKGYEGRQTMIYALCCMFDRICEDYNLCHKNMTINLIDYVRENHNCTGCDSEYARLWKEKDKNSLS